MRRVPRTGTARNAAADSLLRRAHRNRTPTSAARWKAGKALRGAPDRVAASQASHASRTKNEASRSTRAATDDTGQEHDGVGGVQQNVDQMEPARPPTQDPSVEGEGRDDQRPVIAHERGAVPELVMESAERTPGFLEERVLDDQRLVVENVIKAERLQIECGGHQGDEGVMQPAVFAHRLLH